MAGAATREDAKSERPAAYEPSPSRGSEAAQALNLFSSSVAVGSGGGVQTAKRDGDAASDGRRIPRAAWGAETQLQAQSRNLGAEINRAASEASFGTGASSLFGSSKKSPGGVPTTATGPSSDGKALLRLQGGRLYALVGQVDELRQGLQQLKEHQLTVVTPRMDAVDARLTELGAAQSSQAEDLAQVLAAQQGVGVPDGAVHAAPPVQAPLQRPPQDRLSLALDRLGVAGHMDVADPEALVNWPAAPAGALAHPGLTRDQLADLADVYARVQPGFVRRAAPDQTVSTLRALGEAGVTAGRLRTASFAAWLRDTLSQLVVSQMGYSASFMTYNSLLLGFGRGEGGAAHAPTLADATNAAALMTVTAGLMQRLLRLGDMLPGWTRSVAADGDLGQVQPHIDTPSGRSVVRSQYWPFLLSLSYAAFAAHARQQGDGPEGAAELALWKIEARRNWGFAATALVGLYRMWALNRELPWLDGRTPRSRAVMLETIDELCSIRAHLLAAATYTLRPLAGALSMAGHDVRGYVEDRVVRPRGGEPPLPPRRIAPWTAETGLSARRLMNFFLPMVTFYAVSASAEERAGPLLGAAIGSLVLVIGWGYAMAHVESTNRNDPSIADELASGRERDGARLELMHQRRHPPAGQGGAR